MECVRGPLKFQLMMTTVTRIETVFMMKVNRRYLCIKLLSAPIRSLLGRGG